MDFLVQMDVTGYIGDDEKSNALLRQEAQRSRELAAAGILKRLWRIPGKRANWGIWTAQSADELHDALVSLPLFPLMTITVHPLATHPNDPLKSPV